ncbi:CopD family protein [Streptomyces sp. NRRL F-5135]|uniref:CopD family protein n=1 Tax=Streptomyces sp. NRRL F-5135 TaxID=1463858 RepID=UPI00068D6C32|nr:CopD family protein [Streptomyces sp. NRRL F-5135]
MTRAVFVAGGTATALLVALFGAGTAARGTGELRIPAAGATTALRTVVFVALALHLGELAGRRFAGAGPLPRGWSVAAAGAGALASAGQIGLLARVSALDLTSVYGTAEGRLLLVMANGFLLAAACAATRRPRTAAVPLAVVVGAEALRAHPEAYTPLLGAALTVVHLTAASLWTGGLLYVLRTLWLRRGDPAGAREVLRRYARPAGWLFVALAATGTLSTLRRLPADVVFTTAYGRVLIAKLLLVAVASALALRAGARLRGAAGARTATAGAGEAGAGAAGSVGVAIPGVGTGTAEAWPDGTGVAGAARLARAELVVLGMVVVVSAVLTVVPDPHWLSTR